MNAELSVQLSEDQNMQKSPCSSVAEQATHNTLCRTKTNRRKAKKQGKSTTAAGGSTRVETGVELSEQLSEAEAWTREGIAVLGGAKLSGPCDVPWHAWITRGVDRGA